jgi:hypothetical protein
MDGDRKEGYVPFDDGPELAKLQSWYDRARDEAANESKAEGRVVADVALTSKKAS